MDHFSGGRSRGKRRWKRKCGVAREALQKNQRRVRSEYGKRLLRQRGEAVERSFAHVLALIALLRDALRALCMLAWRRNTATTAHLQVPPIAGENHGTTTTSTGWQARWILFTHTKA